MLPDGEPPSPSASGAAESPHARRVEVAVQADAERARDETLRLAEVVGLDREAAGCVALATMELATNLVRYGRHGVIILRPVAELRGTGVCVESIDEGPGIVDLDLALADGYSTGGGLGGGLPAVRRLMDSFEITSDPRGTRILACKWPAGH